MAIRHRKKSRQEGQGKRPDVRLSLVDDEGHLNIEVGFAEIKSAKHSWDGPAVSKDIVRLGLLLKDAIDTSEDLYGVTTAIPLGIMLVGSEAAFFMMAKCGNLYLMEKVTTVSVPVDVGSLSAVGSEFRKWKQLELSVAQGYAPLRLAIESGQVGGSEQVDVTKTRFPTTTTPELNKYTH